MITILFALAAMQAAPVGYQTHTLGDGIDKLKSEGRVMCDGEGRFAKNDYGIHYCRYVQQVGGEWYQKGTDLGPDLPNRAATKFGYVDDKLVHIEIQADAFHEQLIGESLESRFGKPTTTETLKFQVRSGAVFPQTVKTWVVGDQVVVFKTPDLSTRRLSVNYTSPKFAETINKRTPANVM